MNFNIDFAAKTGTSQGARDAWLVGYNPNISVGVWIGYKDQSMGLDVYSNHYGTPSARVNVLFAQFMNGFNAVAPDLVNAGSKFQMPEGVVNRSFCGISGLAPSAECSAAGLVRSDLFNANVMLPNKADDSLVSSSFVLMNGEKYRALAETPSEFIVQGGVGISQEYIDRILSPFGGNPAFLFPENSGFQEMLLLKCHLKRIIFHPLLFKHH